jgi:hypothetical protein
MICRHDETMDTIMKKVGMNINEDDIEEAERQISIRRVLLLYLLRGLLRRHRRMEHIFGLRGEPMNDYLTESLHMEHEHIAKLVAMIQSIV